MRTRPLNIDITRVRTIYVYNQGVDTGENICARCAMTATDIASDIPRAEGKEPIRTCASQRELLRQKYQTCSMLQSQLII